MNQVYWNGKVIPADQARLSALSEAVRFGEGVFTTLQIRTGQPRFFQQHWQRLMANAAQCRLNLPWTSVATGTALYDLAQSEGIEEGVGRISLHPEGDQVHILATVSPPRRSPLPPGQGMRLCQYPEPFCLAPCLHGMKLNNYFLYRIAKAYAIQQNCDDAILCDSRNNVVETATANFFVIRKGLLETPPPDSGALPGIIRALVIKHAPTLGLTCRETPLKWEDIRLAEEIFITNSLLQIAPVSWIAELNLNLSPGPVSAQIARLLDTL